MPAEQAQFLRSGILDNLQRGTVGQFLKETIEDNSELSIVSAYFTIYAYAALQAELDQIGRMCFLFGEPRFIRSIDPKRAESREFVVSGNGLKLNNHLEQKRVAKECAAWIRNKVEIRSVKRSNLLHGKLYHLTAPNGRHDAVVGSSNFTVHGLGLAEDGNNNIELNIQIDSRRDREELKVWFDELWNDRQLVEDVTAEVLAYLEKIYADNSPQFIYYKTLYHVFEKLLADTSRGALMDEDIRLTDTHIWQALFEFQKDGVKGAINKMLTHNGCIIADSVGLGKTYEALAIIKYFELRNDKVLVLCPKKLRENWTVYQAQNNSPLNPFVNDRFGYTVLSHTDLSRDGGLSGDINLATINWGNYDLVVIDESHNFRNNTRGKRDEDGNIIRKSRYERLMDDIIKTGVKTKVLLLSATPVNNTLSDLRNQLYFLTADDDTAFSESLGVSSLRDTLANAQRRFTDWAKKGGGDTRDLLDNLDAAFFTLLDELTIARSRKHIQRYYKDTLAALGSFPKREKPKSIYSEIDTSRRFPSYDKLNDEISNYRLSLFNPSAYVRPEYADRYELDRVEQFTQQKREYYLIGMMKVNFLKRLESSVYAFNITMERTIEKIERLEQRIHNYYAVRESNSEIEFEDLQIPDIEDEELQAALQVGGKLKFNLAHLDLDTWLADLANDKQQLNMLATTAAAVTAERDGKLLALKSIIRDKIQKPTKTRDGRPNRKVLVFTAFADTAGYLYDHLRDWARQELRVHIALVTGSKQDKTTLGKAEFNHILTNFSPIAKGREFMPNMPQDEQIDLLIATDCISEGQNLQDCDYLVNYDIHWNPVRIIQRFGRIDRIGSRNMAVHLVNFWPTDDLNKYIKLKARVEARMALVDIAGTNYDNLLDPQEIEDLIEKDLKFRDKQLLRLKDEILDMEDFNETVTLNEFTLGDFRIDLLRYLESNRQALADAPFGLHAVVPANPNHPQIRPGVIFCLRQKGLDDDGRGGEAPDSANVNPLRPYFLVYMQDDGEPRYSFAQPKQILEIYRFLCADQAAVYEPLCALFDVETKGGHDMSRYSYLLDRAVRSIARTFRRRAAAQLTAGRGALLPTLDQQATESSEFELVTWLVIK
jgi:SNF2 family DNA or RNA helicase